MINWKPREARRMRWLEEAAKWSSTRFSKQVPSAPACISGIKTFTPGQALTTDPDYDNDTESIQLFCPTGTTYDVRVPHNTPGVFVAWDVSCTVFYTQQVVVVTNQPAVEIDTTIMLRSSDPITMQNGTADGDMSTPKYLKVPLSYANSPVEAMNYFWNLQDPRSGRSLSDQLIPDVVMLPPATPLPKYEISGDVLGGERGQFTGDGWMRFDAPWVMERDTELVFQWRPLVEIYQLASNTTPTTVSVRVDIHGIKYFFEQDFLNQGARLRA